MPTMDNTSDYPRKNGKGRIIGHPAKKDNSGYPYILIVFWK